MGSRLSLYALKMALLQCFAGHPDHQHRGNVLGRENYPGALERQLRLTFTADERAIAHRGLQQLETDGLLRATWRDAAVPADWLEITPPGRAALQRGALDDLDQALCQLDPALLEIRHGAWAAVCSFQPDAMRQAAHSGRELIRQVLARYERVRCTTWFRGDQITRRNRLRFAMETRHGTASNSVLRVIEAQCAVVEASHHRLSGLAHTDLPVIAEHVTELLRAAEAALKDLLREVPTGGTVVHTRLCSPAP
jgi:hypothetical protein